MVNKTVWIPFPDWWFTYQITFIFNCIIALNKLYNSNRCDYNVNWINVNNSSNGIFIDSFEFIVVVKCCICCCSSTVTWKWCSIVGLAHRYWRFYRDTSRDLLWPTISDRYCSDVSYQWQLSLTITDYHSEIVKEKKLASFITICGFICCSKWS